MFQSAQIQLRQAKPDYIGRLPKAWQCNQNILPADKLWMGQSLFKEDGDLVPRQIMWFYPPDYKWTGQATLPDPGAYFLRRMFLWIPVRLWKCQFRCPECKKELTTHFLYKTVKLVIDMSSYYYIGTEYLDCKSCKTSFAAWDSRLLAQLPDRYASEFPAIQTYQSACDRAVVAMLRGRTLGNSSTAMQQRIHELHSDQYLRCCQRYLNDCQKYKEFCNLTRQPLPTFKELPEFKTPLSARWLQSCYVRDVYSRLPMIEAQLTSVAGDILKLDGTNKICHKLQGTAACSASWTTSVANESGEVLVSVLTTSEDRLSLQPMADGLMQRFERNNWNSPRIMYVDRDCCKSDGPSRFQQLFIGWPRLQVRLDSWHFMRRLGAGCVSESHPLHGAFMSALSDCIFAIDAADIGLLRAAKRGELAMKSMENISERAVNLAITRAEVLRHCKRTTRGEEETVELIESLILTFSTKTNLLGEPLFLKDMEAVWLEQKRHVCCLQDPVGIGLYTCTGTMMKGGTELPVYRCARGSSSLESFHLHLNRFIPGSVASAVNFQAYFIEGLSRWNEERAKSALQRPCIGDQLRSFDTRLKMQVTEHYITNHFI